MTLPTFDTLEAVEEFEKAGFESKEAKIFTKTLTKIHNDSNLATKSDIKEVENKIDLVKTELNSKIDLVENKIDLVETRLNNRIDSLVDKITIKLGIMLTAFFTVAIAILSFLINNIKVS